ARRADVLVELGARCGALRSSPAQARLGHLRPITCTPHSWRRTALGLAGWSSGLGSGGRAAPWAVPCLRFVPQRRHFRRFGAIRTPRTPAGPREATPMEAPISLPAPVRSAA